MKHEPVFASGDYLIKQNLEILDNKQWNWRNEKSKTLVESWIKWLCIYLDAYSKLYECELRTDDVDEFQELLWYEDQLVYAKQIMLDIESIWSNEQQNYTGVKQ